jgi:hypothetical protein
MALKQDLVLLNLSGGATDANGVWYDVSEFEFPLGVIIVGSGASDALIVDVTGKYPLPANSVHDAQVGSYTTDQLVQISSPVRGLKVRKTAATQSSSAYVLLRGNRR